MENDNSSVWRKCSSCKKPIGFKVTYFVCSVSTCNGQRTGYVFCSFPCFEVHLPGARHKQAGAVESVSPTKSESPPIAHPAPSAHQSTVAREPQRILVKTQTSGLSSTQNRLPDEVLIIASRLKEYIQARSEFNTSSSVMDVLSHHVRRLCDRAIDSARSEGRKTVLDRDFDFLKK